jgi:hypothetical protein
VIALVPLIKAYLSNTVKDKELAVFDRIIGDVTDSQSGIHQVLTKIMFDRLEVFALEIVKKITWDAPDQSMFSSNGVSLPMESFVSETTTFHRIISKYLHTAEVKVCDINLENIERIV